MAPASTAGRSRGRARTCFSFWHFAPAYMPQVTLTTMD